MVQTTRRKTSTDPDYTKTIWNQQTDGWKRVALVVGGTGFIGGHVTQTLVESEWEVVHFGPPGPASMLDELPRTVNRIDGSATEAGDVSHAIAEVAPSIVISSLGHNVAATGLLRSSEMDTLEAIRVNAIGMRNVLEAAAQAGVPRVIWISSVVAYGPAKLYQGRQVTESDILRPVTTYGLTKALAEQFSVFYRDTRNLDVCALRIPLVFGPGRWYEGLLGSLMSYLTPKVPLPSEPLELASGSFDLIYALDVAGAVLRLATVPHRLAPAYNLRGFTTDFDQLLRVIEKCRGSGQIPHVFTPERPPYPLMSDELIRREIGFTNAYDLYSSLDDFKRRLR